MNNGFLDVEFKDMARNKSLPENVQNLRRAIVHIIKAGKYEDQFVRGQVVPYSSIPSDSSEPWVFDSQIDLKRRLESRAEALELGSVCNINQGVTAGGDRGLSVFLVQERFWRERRLEADLMFKAIGGENVRAWRIVWEQNWFIYPYQNGRLVELGDFTIDHRSKRRRSLIEEAVIKGTIKYPNIAIYFSSHFDDLINREAEGKSWRELGKKYYELHRPRDARTVLCKPKIVCPRLAQSPRFALDSTGYLILDSCIALTPKIAAKSYKILETRIIELTQTKRAGTDILLYLLAILNSGISEFLIKKTCAFVQNRYYQLSTKKLGKVPVPVPSERDLVTNLLAVVEDLLSGRAVAKETDNFINELFHITKSESTVIRDYNQSH